MINEKIVLAPGVNGTELLRSLAANGYNTFGMRIVSSVELARLALARCGAAIPGSIIAAADEAVLILRSLGGNGYYSETSFPDASAVAKALRSLRQCIARDEANEMKRILERGRFKDKNKALLGIYESYIAYCRSNGLVDAVSLVRCAAEQARPFDCEFCVLREAGITPLDKYLLERITGGAYKTISVSELTGKHTHLPEMPDIICAYGAVNEAEHIIGDIIKNASKTDECVIAVSDTAAYSQLFYDVAVQYDIPVTFGCGVPILNTNPAKLLSLMNKWDTVGYHGEDALNALIFSDSFDRKELESGMPEELRAYFKRAVDAAGDMRLSMDADKNVRLLARFRSALSDDENTVPIAAAAECIFRELEKGYGYMIEKYSLIRKGTTYQGKIDRSAVKVIGDALKPFERFGLSDSIPRAVPDILRKTVSSENSREGFLHVTSIESAQSVLRKRLYIAGLSARLFPGSPKEDPVMQDEDYAAVTDASTAELPTSENLILKKRRALADLVDIYRSLGVQPALSFSGYDLCELKSENPSSALFELYSEAHPQADFEAYISSMRRVGFFENEMSLSHGVGRAYLDGEYIQSDYEAPEAAAGCLPRAFSPSAIETFFACPHKFFLAYILGIRPPEPGDPFIWMDNKMRGTLAHSVMEQSANRAFSEKDFLELCKKTLDEFAAKRPPISDAAKIRDEFLNMMQKAYETDPGNEVILSEKLLSARHSSGITVSGKPDRLERTPDGEYIVVDYKTGANITHKENDPDSCMQTLLYAYMLSDRGIAVSRCEYRYLRYGKTVSCVNNAEMQKKTSEKLDILAAALPEIGSKYTDDNKNCAYCEFAGVCARGLER